MFVVLSLSACQEQIIHDLSELEANRVVSRLHSENLLAEKVLQSDGRWAVSTKKQDSAEALRFLDINRILSSRATHSGFSKGGLVPSREEQWFRYERAVASAIEQSLQAVSGVLEAHVHLNLPQGDPLFGKKQELGSGSSAVLLLIDERFQTSDHDLAGLVAGAAGLKAERVTVLKSVAARKEVVVSQKVSSMIENSVEVAPLSASETSNASASLQRQPYKRFLVTAGFSLGACLIAGAMWWRRVGNSSTQGGQHTHSCNGSSRRPLLTEKSSFDHEA